VIIYVEGSGKSLYAAKYVDTSSAVILPSLVPLSVASILTFLSSICKDNLQWPSYVTRR
jgi:hypothetical protein